MCDVCYFLALKSLKLEYYLIDHKQVAFSENMICRKDIWQGSFEWLEQGFYLLENLEIKNLKKDKSETK